MTLCNGLTQIGQSSKSGSVSDNEIVPLAVLTDSATSLKLRNPPLDFGCPDCVNVLVISRPSGKGKQGIIRWESGLLSSSSVSSSWLCRFILRDF